MELNVFPDLIHVSIWGFLLFCILYSVIVIVIMIVVASFLLVSLCMVCVHFVVE